MLGEFFSEVILQTLLITFFVLCMITVLEYVNVISQGVVNKFMRQKPSVQILLSSFLGLLPGCIGSYAAVSMYTHEVVGFGALLANLIATTGDEAFLMISLMPEKAALIFGVLLILSILAGYITVFFVRKNEGHCGGFSHFHLHKVHDAEKTVITASLKENFKNLNFKRMTLIISLLLFIAVTFTGGFDEDHEGADTENLAIKITFLVLSLLSLFVIISVSNHFLEDHIWNHVIKEHFKKILIWTFAALAVIFLAENFFDINEAVKSFDSERVEIIMLLIAIAVGLIPESGPHIVFISLYCSGAVPFFVLLANCIVQDGHGAIPLFAENKKDFFMVKGIKAAAALLIGTAAIIF